MFEVEDDRLMLTVQGVGGDHPPRDEAGFLDFTRSLRSTVIYETIREAEPLTPIVGFANTANRRRHYERLRRWPERLLAVGDTACAFNPVYGQGISVAALTAARLDTALADRGGRSLDGFAPRFRRDVAAAGRAAWMIATGDDLRYPTTTGATAGKALRMQHRYLDRVMAAATGDEVAMAAMTDALFLVARPESLFKPSVMWRAVRHGGAGDRSNAAPVPNPIGVFRVDRVSRGELSAHVDTPMVVLDLVRRSTAREHDDLMVAGTTTYRPAASGSDAGAVLDVLGRAGLIAEVPATSTVAVLDTFDGRIADAGLRLELVDGHQLILRGAGCGRRPRVAVRGAAARRPTICRPDRCAADSPVCSTCGPCSASSR